MASLGDEARHCRISNANTTIESASTEQEELFWRSGSGPLYHRISTLSIHSEEIRG
ncbi:hypothetical protein M1D70_08195 [Paenibacillus sp. AK002]